VTNDTEIAYRQKPGYQPVKKSNKRKQRNRQSGHVSSKARLQILPALVAVGGIAAGPVAALELGEIKVDSTLGQPLRASIAYALHANERIHDSCIFLRPVRGGNGLPGVGQPRIAVTDSAIVLRGRTPLREPLVAMQLAVQCPDTANLAREYTLMIDLPSPASGVSVRLPTSGMPLARVPTPRAITRDVVTAPESTTVMPRKATPVSVTTPRAPVVARLPIASGARYQVQAGESLSRIVSRIEDRSVALWPAVDAVFAANPHAFMNNDRNLLRAGAWLVIPDMSRVSPATPIEATAPPVATAAAATALPAASTALPTDAAVDEAINLTVDVPVDVAAEVAVVVAGESAVDESLPVGAADIVVDIPETVVEVTQVAPLIPGSRGTDIAATGSWLQWLGGAGLTLLLAALIFSRQIRDRFGSSAIGKSAARPTRRRKAATPRPVTSGSGVEGYDVSITTEFSGHIVEDDEATAKDLQTLHVVEIGNSRFSLISDFERQVFERNFNAAITAAGYASDGIPEVAQASDARGEDLDRRTARAS